MSVFDELVEELKEENLLEETVWDVTRANGSAAESATVAYHESAATPSEDTDDFPIEIADAEPSGVHASATRDQEFFRKRAMDEVSSLQMVEHVFASIEREHMKIAPRAYDDLEVKKALHRYIQVSSSSEPNEISWAEAAVYTETNNWFEALSGRDSDISIANLRRFCENSRPVLSSQALIGLARFYRNSAFSESIRAKFDFVMTRLFSRDLGEEKRKLLFGKSESVGHIHSLYSTWESLSLYSGDEHRDQVVAAKVRFDEIIHEAEAANSFDSLIASDFFNRVRLFKEEIGELFFETNVLAAAMECNVRVGNRFVDLLRKEAGASDIESLEEKYGYSFDSVVSTAASRTIHLLELLRGECVNEREIVAETESEPQPKKIVVDFESAPVEQRFSRLFAVNKWILLVSVLMIAASVGLYFWSENESTAQSAVEKAPAMNLAGSDISTHIREASYTSETLYAVTQPTWDALSDDEQKEFLAKVLVFAESKKLKRVNLVNSRGKTVGVASQKKIEVFGP